MHTACVWSEKLPFAGYSIVKERTGFRLRALGFWPECQRRIFPGLKPKNLKPGAEGYGEYRARTGDLLVANQALSQLS